MQKIIYIESFQLAFIDIGVSVITPIYEKQYLHIVKMLNDFFHNCGSTSPITSIIPSLRTGIDCEQKIVQLYQLTTLHICMRLNLNVK